MVPIRILNTHQLKKESLSLGSKPSNWSAPIVVMLGLVPPVPAAMMYKAKKKIPTWNDDARWQSLSAMPGAHGGGLNAGSDTARVNKHIPYDEKYKTMFCKMQDIATFKIITWFKTTLIRTFFMWHIIELLKNSGCVSHKD